MVPLRLARFVACCLAALAMVALAHPARAQDSVTVLGASGACPAEVTVARMQWPSAALLAEIHARILRAQYGCRVSVIPGDLAASASSMAAAGQPAIAPEMWVSRIAAVWNAGLEAQALRPAGQAYDVQVFEGWFIPSYVAEALPDLRTAAEIATNMAALAPSGRLRFISCPPDWACSLINRNLIRALGLDAMLEIVEPANRFELDTLIAEAASRREPIVFYYWQPNAVIDQFGFRPLDLGPFEPEAFLCLGKRACASPMPTSFAPESVVTAAAEWVFADMPEIATYFQRAAVPMVEMNRLLRRLAEPNVTVEEVADWFVAERKSVWGHWAGLPASEIPVDPPPESAPAQP